MKKITYGGGARTSSSRGRANRARSHSRTDGNGRSNQADISVIQVLYVFPGQYSLCGYSKARSNGVSLALKAGGGGGNGWGQMNGLFCPERDLYSLSALQDTLETIFFLSVHVIGNMSMI